MKFVNREETKPRKQKQIEEKLTSLSYYLGTDSAYFSAQGSRDITWECTWFCAFQTKPPAQSSYLFSDPKY